MSLAEIPVVALDGVPSGNAEALVKEIETLLDSLLRTGEGGTIDLRSLPLSAPDREALRARLGQGEVDIRMDLGGLSSIRETGVPGVWWIAHRDPAGQLVSEFIEVAYSPDLIAVDPDDVESGLAHLRASRTD